MLRRWIRDVAVSLAFVVTMTSFIGCTQHLDPSPISDIPPRALPVKEGSERLFFQSVDPGTVYVFDADTVSLIFSTPVASGERFVLDPMHNTATVEGRPVYEKPFPKHHTFRLYFEPRVEPTTKEAP
jgi:hypothetical protein